jgi:ComF family protein
MSSALQSVKDFIQAGLGFVYPEVCHLCGHQRASPEQCYLCSACRELVRFVVPPFCDKCGLPFRGAITTEFECSNCKERDWAFSSARAVVIARDTMLEIIHRYKYQHALWFEPYLAQLLIDRAASELHSGGWDLIVPVPLHPTKEREREFNQAQRLARRLSLATGIPMDHRLIRRTQPTLTQTLLSREERLDNVRKAFAPRRGLKLVGRRIILIDDVFTTGATTGACARVLRDCGAEEVCVWTLARGV